VYQNELDTRQEFTSGQADEKRNFGKETRYKKNFWRNQEMKDCPAESADIRGRGIAF